MDLKTVTSWKHEEFCLLEPFKPPFRRNMLPSYSKFENSQARKQHEASNGFLNEAGNQNEAGSSFLPNCSSETLVGFKRTIQRYISNS
jgi:hypothetical protein